ncbi:hypothetical protein IGI04_004332 [Brassica rapa subsp. trilocularis]|uniref:Uncharacterized protein n=1 Tax=Brassica rapa subsp. trilocularis TaxID=1813537 RepID=A0ABQ7NBF5_BRACM|nr:hypothetical protein IGI04_004332 [Brassica rapa subsp. trilocularis]
MHAGIRTWSDLSIPEVTRRRSKSRPGRSTEKKKRIQQGLLRYVPVVRTSPEESKSSQSFKGLDDPGEINTPAPSIQDLSSGELEEGEICPAVLEDNSAIQLALTDDIETPQLTGGKQCILEAQITVTADRDGATADVTNQFPTEDRVEMTTDPGGLGINLITSTLEELVQSSPDTIEGPPEVVVHASPIADEVLPEVLLSEVDYRPVEEDEQENPFILVKNRKSSRKAAKRH